MMKFLKETYFDNPTPLLMYILRWQISTPIFLILGMLMMNFPYWLIIIISNIFGSLVFFPIDRWIILKKK